MERLGRPRLKRAGLVAALAILPLTPLVAMVVLRTMFGTGPQGQGLFATALSWVPVAWMVLLVALVVVPIPAGLTLMRRPDASGAWALGLVAIALGVIGTAYAATKLALAWPEDSPAGVLMVVALCTVPAAAGFLLMRKKGLSDVQALGHLAIALGAIGVIWVVTWLPQLLMSEDPSPAELAASIGVAMILSATPLVVGSILIQKKNISTVSTLGLLVIVLGVLGAIYSALRLWVHLAYIDRWTGAIPVDLSLVAALCLAPAIVGISLLRRKSLTVAASLGRMAIALGVVGTTYCVAVLFSTFLLSLGTVFLPEIIISIVMIAPLVGALSVVPVSAGVILVRNPDASGVWALGLMSIVFGVIGTTFSATQFLASGAPSIYSFSIGMTLLNSAWLP